MRCSERWKNKGLKRDVKEWKRMPEKSFIKEYSPLLLKYKDGEDVIDEDDIPKLEILASVGLIKNGIKDEASEDYCQNHFNWFGFIKRLSITGAISIKCIGWIPTVSGNISLLNPFGKTGRGLLDIKTFDLSNYSGKIEQRYMDIMSNYSFQFEKNVHLSDKKIDSAESHLFVYLLSTSDILKEILVFREDANQKLLKLIIHVTIQDIQPRGLIKFESSEGTFDDIKSENAFINQVYINIRNLYHEHTHHDGDDSTAADSLLLLSLNNDNNSKALNEIFRNRQRKIITYHKLIKDALKETCTKVAVEATHSLIRQAKGEFIYSIIFLDLYFFRSKRLSIACKVI